MKDNQMLAFHTRINAHESRESLCRFIEEGLSVLHFNTLILELNPGYRYECFPEFSTGTLNRQDIREILKVCRKHRIKLIPLFQCLSHQSDYGGKPWPLYLAHKEFLERPNVSLNAKWPEIYCHSWCCSNDGIYEYVYPMMDELIDVFETDTIHIGMDEVFDIGEDECPRCRGKNKAELFAETVRKIYRHFEEKQIRVMMWGDRLLDAKKMNYGIWEADKLGIYVALQDRERISRNILITDWHYDRYSYGYPSIDLFLDEGFTVIPSVFMDPNQAKHMCNYMVEAEYIAKKNHASGKLGGILCTHWDAFDEERSRQLLKGIEGAEPENRNTSYLVGRVLAEVVRMYH